MDSLRLTYLIDGGAPAGNSALAGLEGCRTTKANIVTMTIHGNNSTAPRGIDTFELPFNRIRLRNNANLGVIFSLDLDMSPKEGKFSREGRLGDEGIRFARFCTSPIDAECWRPRQKNSRHRKQPKVKVRSRTDRCDMRKDNQKRISRPNLLIMAFPSVFRGSDPGIVTSDDRESSGRKSPGTLLLVVSEVNCRYLTVSWRRSTGKHSSQISTRT